MKSRSWTSLLVTSLLICTVKPSFADIKAGDKLQTIANLHPDMQRHVLYTLNYQLPGLIPVCSDVTITQVGKKKLTFEYQGQFFEIGYEGFSEGAGVSFQKAVQTIYFGATCDRAKMQSLSNVDKEGIRTGKPGVGMTRDGILFAMGRPPFHANPDLNAPSWRYWRNRYGQMAIDFDANGKVSAIR